MRKGLECFSWLPKIILEFVQNGHGPHNNLNLKKCQAWKVPSIILMKRRICGSPHVHQIPGRTGKECYEPVHAQLSTCTQLKNLLPDPNLCSNDMSNDTFKHRQESDALTSLPAHLETIVTSKTVWHHHTLADVYCTTHLQELVQTSETRVMIQPLSSHSSNLTWTW